MSAFIVSRRHIEVLANALLAYGIVPIDETDMGAQEWTLGTLLWNENIRSVSALYRNEPIAQLPGPKVESYVYLEADVEAVMEWMLQPWAILSLVDSWKYQSCEGSGWEGSPAWAYMDALEAELLRTIGMTDVRQARRRPEMRAAEDFIYAPERRTA